MELKKTFNKAVKRAFNKKTDKQGIDTKNDEGGGDNDIIIKKGSKLDEIRSDNLWRLGLHEKDIRGESSSRKDENEKKEQKNESIVDGDNKSPLSKGKGKDNITIPAELMNEIKSELANARERINTLLEITEENKKLRNLVKNWKEKFSKNKEDNEKLEKDNTNLAKNNEKLEKDNTNLAKNNEKLEKDNTNLAKDNTNLAKDKAMLAKNNEKLEKDNLSRKLMDTMVAITGDMFDAKQGMRTSDNTITKHLKYVEEEVEDDIARHEAGSLLVPIEIKQYLGKLSKILEILKVEQQSFTEKKDTFNKQKQMLIDNQKLCDSSQLTQFIKSPLYEKKEVKDMEEKLGEFIGRCEENKKNLGKILHNYETQGKPEKVKLAEKIYSADYTNLPDNDKIENTKEQFAILFPKAAENYPGIIEDLAKVAHIFMDRKYCDGVLKDLQEQMVSKIRQEGKASLQDVLIDYLRNKHGFNEYIELTGIAGRDEFQQHLEDGRPLVDLGAGAVHGWASHLLQTYLMCKAYDDNKLTNKPLEIYQAMGKKEFAHRKSDFATLWNFIFDNNAMVDVLYGDPGIRSALGIPEDIPNIRKKYMQGYAGAENIQDNIIGAENIQDNIFGKDFPNGPLKEQLALTYLQMEHFVPTSLLSEEKIKESVASGIARAEEEYSKKEIEIRALKEDLSTLEVGIKYPEIEENVEYWKKMDSSKMDLSYLEERYAKVQRKLGLRKPTRYFLDDDYLAARKKILDDNQIPGIIRYERSLRGKQ